MAKTKEDATAAAEAQASIENPGATTEAETSTENPGATTEAETSIENATAAAEAETSTENADTGAEQAETIEGGAGPGTSNPAGPIPPETEGAAGADNEAEDRAAQNAARLAALEELLNRIGAATAGGKVPDDLRQALEKTEGALTLGEQDTVTVTLFGITAGSPFGLHRALLDWCMAATRVIMSGKAPE